MNVTEAIERNHYLAGQGRPEEGLKVLIEASHENSDPALELEIALCYAERAWARCEDPSLTDTPSAQPASIWDDGTRSNGAALDDFEESLSWSERPEALAGKAFVLLGSDPELADRLLQRASELDPDSALVVAVSSRLFLRRGEWARAVESASKAIEAAPEFPAAHLALADALRGSGKAAEALDVLARAASAMPYNAGLLVAWAGALDAAGEAIRAGDVWRRATEIKRLDPAAWRGLAWNAAARGEEDLMARAVGEADRLDPAGTLAWIEREAGSRPELRRARSSG